LMEIRKSSGKINLWLRSGDPQASSKLTR